MQQFNCNSSIPKLVCTSHLGDLVKTDCWALNCTFKFSENADSAAYPCFETHWLTVNERYRRKNKQQQKPNQNPNPIFWVCVCGGKVGRGGTGSYYI